MPGGRRRDDDYPTLHEDERDPAYDRLPVAAPEGPPPEGQRDEDEHEPKPREPFSTLHEDERDPAYDRMPVAYPDGPPPDAPEKR